MLLKEFFISLFITNVISWCLQSTTLTTLSSPKQLDLSTNNQFLAVGFQNYATIYNVATLTPICNYNYNGLTLTAVKFFSDVTKIAFGFQNDLLYIVNSTSCVLINSFNTGHTNIYDIDININSTRLVTCGLDKSFRVWNISSPDILTSTPPLLGGGFDTEQVVLQCKFSGQDQVMVGLRLLNKIKIYTQSYGTTVYLEKTFIPAGNARKINYYNCQRNDFLVGSDNGGAYAFNSTSPFLQTSGVIINVALIDQTNQFIAIGRNDFQLYLYEATDFDNFQQFDLGDQVLCGDFFDHASRLAVGCLNNVVKFLKRCDCVSDTLTYNTRYCPISNVVWPICVIKNNNIIQYNGSNSTELNSTNSTNNTNSTDFNSTNSTTSNNSTINQTNSTSNISNSTNSTNLTNNFLNSLTVQQFFESYFNSDMLNSLNHDSNLKLSTVSGPLCNQLITIIEIEGQVCSNYLMWSEYIRIFHSSIQLKGVSCSNKNNYTLEIQSIIIKDINDPQNIFVVLPNSQLIGRSVTVNLTDWNTFLSKVQANYDSLSEPVVYTQDECNKKQTIHDYIKAMLIVSSIIMLIGIFSGRIVGLELFGVLQLSYFSLMNHDKLNINLLPLSEFKIFNGYNIQIQQESKSQVPSNVWGINMYSEFLNNFNIMLLISIVILAMLFLINRILKNRGGSRIGIISLNLFKQSAVTLALFNSLNIGFSAGIHIKYSASSKVPQLYHIFSTLALIIVLLSLSFLIFALQFFQSFTYGQFKDKFKNTIVNKCYISFLLIIRVGLGIYLSHQNQSWQATLFALGVQIFFILYFIINLPYKSTLHNYRSGIIHLSQSIILLSSNFYRSMKMNTIHTIKGRIYGPAILQLIMIGISVGVSTLATIVQLIRLIKKNQDEKKIQKINIKKVQQSINVL